jgi:hypothetical protein
MTIREDKFAVDEGIELTIPSTPSLLPSAIEDLLGSSLWTLAE